MDLHTHLEAFGNSLVLDGLLDRKEDHLDCPRLRVAPGDLDEIEDARRDHAIAAMREHRHANVLKLPVAANVRDQRQRFAEGGWPLVDERLISPDLALVEQAPDERVGPLLPRESLLEQVSRLREHLALLGLAHVGDSLDDDGALPSKH